MDYSVAGAQTEVYVYDDLGNRITYTRDSTDIVYTNNTANEYATIDTAGGGAVSVYYDAAGNLSRDENDFEYAYDYDNRLTLISYDDGQALTQVVAYEYDALGRMVSSQLRFDSDTDGDTETLKYYYDGQNAIAEYDMSDNLSRRYVHGTQYVDERALLIEGEPATADTYYYLLQELYTVAGLIKRNGTLAEAYTYDAYGKVQPWGYRDFDFNRDGDVDKTNDQNVFLAASTATGGTTSDPMADADMDGDADKTDSIAFNAAYTGPGAAPIALKLSAVGNPYFFTGRRLHYVEDLAAAGLNANKQVQYNRARHYDPDHGRWLQRDPLMYVDGMSLYEYVKSDPAHWYDPFGRCCPDDSNPEAKKRRKCCVTSYAVPWFRSGSILQNLFVSETSQNEGGQRTQRWVYSGQRLFERFEMHATFSDEGDCCASCCEYRQEVKGEFRVNGNPVSPAGVKKDKFSEDCASYAGSRICFGHRKAPGRENDVYSKPDRKTGKKYTGSDTVSITGDPAERLEIDLTFRGVIIDVCQKGLIRRESTWRVEHAHRVDQEARSGSGSAPDPRPPLPSS